MWRFNQEKTDSRAMREDSTGREGGRKEEGRGAHFLQCQKKKSNTWITSILIWDVVIQGERMLGKIVDREGNKRQLISDSETEEWMKG